MKTLGEGNTTYDLTPPTTLLMNTDTSQIYLLPVRVYDFNLGTNLTFDKNHNINTTRETLKDKRYK